MIKTAVSQVPGVTGQTIEVTNYLQASLLTELLITVLMAEADGVSGHEEREDLQEPLSSQ